MRLEMVVTAIGWLRLVLLVDTALVVVVTLMFLGLVVWALRQAPGARK